MNWKSLQTTHEGSPLMLRYQVDLDIEALKPKYQNLVVLRHKLSKVLTNGLPEADYNESLFGLDESIRDLFRLSLHGVTVIIETFGGNRNYYVYVDAKEHMPNIIQSLKNTFPREDLSWTIHVDPEWGFFSRYSKDFLGD